MTTWPKNELRKIAESDDVYMSPFRAAGKPWGRPTWIWCVAVDDALYVRAWSGRNSMWYRAAMRQKMGRITAPMTKEVTFEPISGSINDCIDDAYRANTATAQISAR
jgi:hypothetical protein